MDMKILEEEKLRINQEHKEIKRITELITNCANRIGTTNNARPLTLEEPLNLSYNVEVDNTYKRAISDLAAALIEQAQKLLLKDAPAEQTKQSNDVKIDL